MLATKKMFSDLPWRLLTVEAVLVILSVLLALALDSWRKDREDQKLAQLALQEFANEVQSNCAQIIAAFDLSSVRFEWRA